jgi:hypothetical protein
MAASTRKPAKTRKAAGPTKARKRAKPARRAKPKSAGKTRRPNPFSRVQKLCLSLPEAHEVEAWGEPTFRVKNKIFAMYAANSHHGDGRNGVWCKAAAINQRLMVEAAPERFFVPPYVGPSGWVGVYLDRDVDWDELKDLLWDAWRMTAPRKLLAKFRPVP